MKEEEAKYICTAVDELNIPRCYGHGRCEDEAKLNAMAMVIERCLKKYEDYYSGKSRFLDRHIFKHYNYKIDRVEYKPKPSNQLEFNFNG